MNIRSIIRYGQGAWSVAMCAALLVLAGCQRDELWGDTPDKNTLNFYVGVADEWNYGNAKAAADSAAAKENNPAKSRSLPDGQQPSAVMPAVRAFSLDAAPGADSLYLHTSVSDAIEAASFGKGKTVTRGTPVNSKDEFYDAFGIFGYFADAWSDSGMDVYFHNAEVKKGSGEFWTPTTEYRWPGGSQSLCIWAYAPYNATGLTLPSDDGTAPAFTYTVPDDVKEQKDLLIAEPNPVVGEPTNGTLPLTFRHVLTAVRFVVGDDVRKGSVKSISLKGVNGKGTYRHGATNWDLSGDPVKDFAYEFTTSKPVGGEDTGSGTQITPEEATFMMIPQTLPEGAQIEVVFTEEKTGADYRLTASIGKDEWKMGQTVTYRISITGFGDVPAIEVEFSGAIDDNTVEFDHKASTDIYGNPVPLKGTFTVKSYSTVTKAGHAATYYDQPWTAEFSTDGTNWSSTLPDDWFEAFPTSGTGSHDASTQEFTVKDQIAIENDYHNQRLKAESSVSGIYDLSTKGGTAVQRTANCYIINRPGTYKLPLVYGNAIDYAALNNNNGVNETAYYCYSGSSNNKVLEWFKDHLDNEIKQPYIYKQEDFTVTDAVLIWQDREDMIDYSTIKLTEPNEEDKFTYLQFTTAGAGSESFQQGNAIIAVRDENRKVVWSWHIWVTDYVPGQSPSTDAYSPGDIAKDINVTSSGKTYTFMGTELGLCNANSLEYEPRTVKVRFKQTNNPDVISEVYNIEQTGYKSEELGNVVYYQFGRKDPMLPLHYDNNYWLNDKTHYVDPSAMFADDNSNYKFSSHGDKKVSIGTAIQHPHHFHVQNMATHYVSDWCDKIYYNLWNSKQTTLGATSTVTKTIYDPSPVGYCVPPADAFAGFTLNGANVNLTYGEINSPYKPYYYEVAYNNGWMFYNAPMSGKEQWNASSGTNFWLAMGYRYYGTGGGGHVGINGHFWSANPNNDRIDYDESSYYFFFDRTNVAPKYTKEGRSMGYPVRPVTEDSCK